MSTITRPLPVSADFPVLACALALPATITWLRFYHLDETQPAAMWTGIALEATLFCLPMAWVVLFRGKRFSPKLSSNGVGEGIASGLFALLVLFALYYGWLEPSGRFTTSVEAIVRNHFIQLGILDKWGYVAFGLFYSLTHTFLEEYYWRWFTFGRLCRSVSVPAAIFLSSLSFAAPHAVILAFYYGWLGWPTIASTLAVAIAGAYWAWLYQRSGSLLGPWLSHVLVDAALFAIGYDIARSFI